VNNILLLDFLITDQFSIALMFRSRNALRRSCYAQLLGCHVQRQPDLGATSSSGHQRDDQRPMIIIVAYRATSRQAVANAHVAADCAGHAAVVLRKALSGDILPPTRSRRAVRACRLPFG
jgi:hypothetical protein